MAQRAGEARTLHPAQLIAERPPQRAACEHVSYLVMRQHNFITGFRDAVTEDEVIGVKICSRANATGGFYRVTPHRHHGAQGKLHAVHHLSYENARRHRDRHSQGLELRPDTASRNALVKTRHHPHLRIQQGRYYVTQEVGTNQDIAIADNEKLIGGRSSPVSPRAWVPCHEVASGWLLVAAPVAARRVLAAEGSGKS